MSLPRCRTNFIHLPYSCRRWHGRGHGARTGILGDEGGWKKHGIEVKNGQNGLVELCFILWTFTFSQFLREKTISTPSLFFETTRWWWIEYLFADTLTSLEPLPGSWQKQNQPSNRGKASTNHVNLRDPPTQMPPHLRNTVAGLQGLTTNELLGPYFWG